MAWLGTWANRLKITLDHTKFDSDETDFPHPVHLSADAGPSGNDLSCVFEELGASGEQSVAFATSDGTTEIYAESELWDYLNAEAWYHVKVPAVSSSVDTVIYFYYDLAQGANTAYVGTSEDAVVHNVWDSDFNAVWHMAQDPDGDVSGAIKESTVAALDLTPNGSMTTADLVSAKVGDGLAFDGTGDCLESDGNQSSLNIGASDDFFIDFLIYFDAMPTNLGESDHIFSLANPTDDRRSYICDLILSTKYYLRFHTYNGTAATTAFAQIELETSELVVDTWYHIAIQRSGNLVYFYINGDLHDSGVAFNPASIYNNTDDPFYINSYDGTWSMGEFTIDEFRMTISDARSDSWAKATYNSLWDAINTFSEIPISGTLELVNSLLDLISVSGDLDLVNALKLGSTLSLNNSLNDILSGDIDLKNNILQALSGNLSIAMTIEERAKASGTLSLLNRILASGDGVNQANYVFSKGHGL